MKNWRNTKRAPETERVFPAPTDWIWWEWEQRRRFAKL